MKRVLATALAALISALVVYGFVPPPHQARAQFADQGSWAGNATLNTGVTPNLLTISLANVASLNDIIGVPIRFIPPANNNNLVNVVITNVLGSTSATALKRPSSIGLTTVSLNELWSGEPSSVTYDGTEFVLSSNTDSRGIGDTIETRNSIAPRGTLLEDGSCVSQTQFAALFTVIGTTYNAGAPVSCSGSQFALPDSRGSLFAALDNQGANGAANRITNAGSGCTATGVGTRCGSQNYTQQRSDLVNTSIGISVSSSVGNIAQGSLAGGFQSASGTSQAFSSGSTGSVTSTGSFNLNNNVTQTAMPHVPPVLLGLRAIKY